MKTLLFVLCGLAVGCGGIDQSNHLDTIPRRAASASVPCPVDSLSLTTDCLPGVGIAPVAVIVPIVASTLTVTGPVGSSARLPGNTLVGWQTLSPTAPKTFSTPALLLPGQCQQVDVKILVSGTLRYSQGNSYAYQFCLDNGDVLISTAAKDVRVHSSLGALTYKFVGTNAFVCLD